VGVEADFCPSQAEELAAAQAEAEGQDVERAQRLVVGGGEDGTRLRDRETAVDLVFGRGDLNEFGDVVRYVPAGSPDAYNWREPLFLARKVKSQPTSSCRARGGQRPDPQLDERWSSSPLACSCW
jgi:hypothetical protein